MGEKMNQGHVPQDMLEILMNGVFAFSMTLIVKNNIPFPSGTISEDIPYFINYFMSIFFDGFSFVFTFILLAFLYILVFEIMRHVTMVDRIFLYGMLLFLFLIVFIPLTSLLWNITDKPVPYGILFHANIIGCGITLIAIWMYSCKNYALLDPCCSCGFIQNLTFRIGVFPVTGIVGLIFDCQEISFAAVPLIILYLIPIMICVRFPRDE